MKAEIFVAVLLLSASTRLAAQSPTGDERQVENAAVKYLRADVSLRQSYPLVPDATAALRKLVESPLDSEDEKLVEAAGEALDEFHHGATSKRCDWAISTEDGALANTAHRGAIMELVYVSGLRARLRFRDGDTTGAMSDLLAAMAAARHLSVDGSLASVLFAYRLENTLSGILAQDLYRISPTQLRKLASDLDGLPSGSNLGMAYHDEKVRRNEFFDIGQEARTREDLIRLILKKIPILQSDEQSANAIVEGCGGTIKGFLDCVDQQRAFYTAWDSRFSLPPEQFENTYKAEIEKVSAKNLVIHQFTPNLPRFRWADAYCQTRRALIQAAIAVRLNGPNELNQQPDPYDRKPFTYVPVDNGFRLESRLRENGVPLSLSIISR
jgi:hypothetical protein